MGKLVGILLLALALGGPALAEEPTAQQKAKVRAKIKRARVFYEGGSYDQAVAEYMAAYKIVPIPDILFNVGQIWRTKPDPQKAIVAYEQYLEVAPEGGHADDAKQHIQALYRELVPEKLREKYDAVKQELAAFQARHGDALDPHWDAIKKQLKAGDGDVDGLLTQLRQDIERREKPAEVAEAPAAAPAVATVKKPKARRETPPLLKKWWFWTAAFGGVAVVALSVGLGVGLSGDRDPTPTIGVLK